MKRYYKVILILIVLTIFGCGEQPIVNQPKNVTITPTETNIKISWDEVENATSYGILYSDSTKVFKKLATTSATSINVTKAALKAGDSNFFKVRGINTIGEGPLSNEALITIPPIIVTPGAPQNLSKTKYATKITLNWNVVQGATGYKLYSKNSPTGILLAVAGLTTIGPNNCDIPLNKTGSSIFYAVSAYNSSGEGDYSSLVEVTAESAVITPSAIIAITSSSIDYDGPIFSGNYLLVANASRNSSSLYSTGTLPTIAAGSIKREAQALDKNGNFEGRRIDVNLKYVPTKEERANIKRAINRVSYSVGATKNFWVVDFSNDGERDVQMAATLVYRGVRCEVWVSNRNVINDANAKLLADEFDNNIYPSVTSNFYTPSDVDGNGRVEILCYDILDDYATKGKYTGGYFYSRDLYNTAYSNQMEVFYIDTYPSMGNDPTKPVDVKLAYSTLAHEFQHMVNCNKVNIVDRRSSADMDNWLDEGMAMASEQIYGKKILNYRISDLNQDRDNFIKNGMSLTNWKQEIENYSLAYLFIQYIKEQCGIGDAIFKEILNTRGNSPEMIETLAKKYINPDITFEQLLVTWRAAMVLKQRSGLYGYRGNTGFDTINYPLYEGTGTVLEGGGAVIKKITNSATKESGISTDIKYAGIKTQ